MQSLKNFPAIIYNIILGDTMGYIKAPGKSLEKSLAIVKDLLCKSPYGNIFLPFFFFFG